MPNAIVDNLLHGTDVFLCAKTLLRLLRKLRPATEEIIYRLNSAVLRGAARAEGEGRANVSLTDCRQGGEQHYSKIIRHLFDVIILR